jgi:alkylhydroperoxidase family enzyme
MASLSNGLICFLLGGSRPFYNARERATLAWTEAVTLVSRRIDSTSHSAPSQVHMSRPHANMLITARRAAAWASRMSIRSGSDLEGGTRRIDWPGRIV